MMSEQEKAFLYNIAKYEFRGDGIIVDAGLFLGASTNALATGLGENDDARRRMPAGRRPITSYDIAVWVPSMNQHLSNAAVKAALDGWTPEPGASFEGLLRRMLARHEAVVDLRIGDFHHTARNDEPVEIAFYDCLKTASMDQTAFRVFAPHYIPGRTLVIQQDYFYDRAQDHRIRQELFAPYFDYLGEVTSSACFRLRSPIPAACLARDPVEELTVDQKLTLLQQAAERAARPRSRVFVLLSIVEFVLQQQGRSAAVPFMSEIDRIVARVDAAELRGRPIRRVKELRDKVRG